MIKAKFNTDTKKLIVLRDNYLCIICGKKGTDCHHVYFGTQSKYGKGRNDITQGVTLCRKHHEEVHGCKQGEGIRQQCINYLENFI